jgi:C_GCAxxG_C_C family probable redox protein
MNRAVEFHKEGYNCAESILKALNEEKGLDIPVSMASPFGSGMTVGSTCGAVTGALMAIGALKGRESSENVNGTKQVTRELMDKVREKYETFQCMELKRKDVSCNEIIEYSYNMLKEFL